MGCWVGDLGCEGGLGMHGGGFGMQGGGLGVGTAEGSPQLSLLQALRSRWPVILHPHPLPSLWTPKPAPCPPSPALPPWPCTHPPAPPPSTRCTPQDPRSTTLQVSTGSPLKAPQPFGGAHTDPPFLSPQHHHPTSPHSPVIPVPEPLGDSCLNGDTHRGHSGGGVLLSPPRGRNSAL